MINRSIHPAQRRCLPATSAAKCRACSPAPRRVAAMRLYRHRGQLPCRSGCCELFSASLHSVDNCVSNHGTVPGIVAFEKDHGTLGSTPVLTELLEVRYVDDVQRGILLESFQRNDLGAGSPADTP